MAAAVAGLVLAVPSALAADQVKLKTNGTSFTGTDKNTGTMTHNFISIGTAGANGQENNPVTSFTFNGQSCQLYAAYGSAYCSVKLAPGATATFSGTTQSATTSFTFCTSDNSGINNDCNGVTASSGGAPAGLLAAFVQLDRDMTRVIDKADASLFQRAAFINAITALANEKRKLINNYFAGEQLFGVSANVVITGFDVTDTFLGKATREAFYGHTAAAVGYLEHAKAAKQHLEKEFADAGETPGGLSGGFVHLDRDMTRVIDKADASLFQRAAFINAITALANEKRKLINNYFAGEQLFGVSANVVITGFDVTDTFLGKATREAFYGHTAAAVGYLEHAKAAKQHLEKEFQGQGNG